jgi:hypothetical protein
MRFTSKKLAENSSVIDGVRDAEKLLASINENAANQQSQISKLEAELADVALGIASDELPTGAGDELYARLQAAKQSLSMAQAALQPAQKRLVDSELALRRHNLRDRIKSVEALGVQRAQSAAGFASAIASLNEHFKNFYDASDKIHVSWQGARMPAEVLIGGAITTAIALEMWKVSGQSYLGGGQQRGRPSLPGAACADQRRAGQPEKLPSLVDVVADANRRLVLAVEQGAV